MYIYIYIYIYIIYIGAMFIFDVKNFIKQYKRSNAEHYRHLEHDPTIPNNEKVQKLKTRFINDQLISSNITH